MLNFLSINIGNLSMSASKFKLLIIMAVYFGIYLAEIICNLNFAILIVNEMYGRNRSLIREPEG
jgi:hypothetical protein